jgi:hypothetical protein
MTEYRPPSSPSKLNLLEQQISNQPFTKEASCHSPAPQACRQRSSARLQERLLQDVQAARIRERPYDFACKAACRHCPFHFARQDGGGAGVAHERLGQLLEDENSPREQVFDEMDAAELRHKVLGV